MIARIAIVIALLSIAISVFILMNGCQGNGVVATESLSTIASGTDTGTTARYRSMVISTLNREIATYATRKNNLIEAVNLVTDSPINSGDQSGLPCPLDHHELQGRVLTSTRARINKSQISALYRKYGGCTPHGAEFLEILARVVSKEDPHAGWTTANPRGVRWIRGNGLFEMLDKTCADVLLPVWEAGTDCTPFAKDGETFENVEVQVAGAAGFVRRLSLEIADHEKNGGFAYSRDETMYLMVLYTGYYFGDGTLHMVLSSKPLPDGSLGNLCEKIVDAAWMKKVGRELDPLTAAEKRHAVGVCKAYQPEQ